MSREFGAARMRAALLLSGGMLAGPVLAIGLGEATVRSAPGEPLDVSIPVLCGANECDHFDAALGGSADYRAAGLPEPQLRGRIEFGYDRALDAIRVRTTEPVPPQDLHLLFDLRSGSTRLRKDVVVLLTRAQADGISPAQPAGSSAPQTLPAAAEPPLPVPAPAAAATVPVRQGAPTAPRTERPHDAWGQFSSLLKSLDPAQIATGVGIGAGLILAYVLFRLVRAVLRGTGQVFSRWIGGIRYRWAERRRERDREALAPDPLPPQPSGKPRSGSLVPGRAGGSGTPLLKDLSDEQARRLRQQIEVAPERLDLKLKLAERLFAVQDADAYTELVMALKPILKDTAWERLRKMGQQLRPYDDRFLNLSDRGTVDTVPLIKSNY